MCLKVRQFLRIVDGHRLLLLPLLFGIMIAMNNTSVMILDGGMGRELKRRGAPFRQPEWSALAMMEAPEVVREIHADYIASGARLITTNSYALVPFHIGETVFKEQGLALAKLSGEVAREAADAGDTPVKVAGSLPPLFGSYRADFFNAEKVEALVTPLIKGLAPTVDLWLAETESLIAEPVAVKAIVDKLCDTKKPFWVAFTLEDSLTITEPVLRSGETVAEAVKMMHDIGVDAVLFNCCQPEVIEQALLVARKTLTELGQPDFPLGAYANAFPPQSKEAKANDDVSQLRGDLSPSEYLRWAKQWQKAGATLIGGCCGIGPEHIAVLAEELA